METRYLYKNVKIDDRTKEYVDKRLGKIEKVLKKILQCEIEIDLDKKGKFRAEIMVQAPKKLYRSEEISESIEGAVDVAVEEIIRQIGKSKDRLKELRERGARSIKKKVVLDKNARF